MVLWKTPPSGNSSRGAGVRPSHVRLQTPGPGQEGWTAGGCRPCGDNAAALLVQQPAFTALTLRPAAAAAATHLGGRVECSSSHSRISPSSSTTMFSLHRDLRPSSCTPAWQRTRGKGVVRQGGGRPAATRAASVDPPAVQALRFRSPRSPPPPRVWPRRSETPPNLHLRPAGAPYTLSPASRCSSVSAVSWRCSVGGSTRPTGSPHQPLSSSICSLGAAPASRPTSPAIASETRGMSAGRECGAERRRSALSRPRQQAAPQQAQPLSRPAHADPAPSSSPSAVGMSNFSRRRPQATRGAHSIKLRRRANAASGGGGSGGPGGA